MKIDRAGFMRYNGGALKAAPKERFSYMIGIIGAMEIEVAGITAALLVVRDLQARGVTPARDIVVTALRCEEQGLIGSRAMMGKLSEADLGRRWTPDSPTLAERLTAQGYDVARLS